MTGVTQVLALEEALGVTAGHDTTVAFIERAIAELDGPSPQSGTSPRGSGKGRSV